MNRRGTHRKRLSALRLSSDTTSTLPEYIAWQRPEPDTPSDQPPGYPDSAEEADEDTDSDSPRHFSPSQPASPRKFRRRRKQPNNSSDPYLDSLLERSVHALEMSNVLLQSQASTQSTLTPVLSSDSQTDSALESSARVLSSRLNTSWADDLDEISRGVDRLFADDDGRQSLSSSLPSSSPIQHRYRRRPSLDLRAASDTPHLRYAAQDRSHLISPPPRALTQYLASDADTIVLPSTIGLRAASSSHHTNLHSTVSSPVVTDRHEPTTRAYNMLSSFVRTSTSGSSTPSSTYTSPRTSFLGGKRNTSSSTEREHHAKSSPASETHESRRSRSRTPKLPGTPPLRCMTPPIEESSSSSSDGCPAKQTVSALRKILDEQPPPPPQPSFADLHPPPSLISPAPLAAADTSTATASVSRLFTKSIHSSSTRPPSPPRHSSLKPTSATPSPRPSPSPISTSMSIPDMLGAGVALALGGSRPGSGRSTPKRISFAELPESYASSRPEGASSKFQEKKNRSKTRRHNKTQSLDASRRGGSSKSKNEESWWMSWLVGPSSSQSGIRQMEDRMDRGWGSRMGSGYSGLDEWTV